jgi:uncharacterized protein YutE (UPF0331/DUF86 family)
LNDTLPDDIILNKCSIIERCISGHAFKLLADNGIITKEIFLSLQKMVGFRNIAAHNYQELDQAVLFFVIKKGFHDFIRFCDSMSVKISGI